MLSENKIIIESIDNNLTIIYDLDCVIEQLKLI